MEPLYILTAVTIATLTLGTTGLRRLRPLRRWHVALRVGLAAMFTFTGIAHFGAFGMRDDLVAMVPAALPAPELLVTITGALELAGAVGLLLTATSPWAAAGLTLLLVTMFPANVYKALNDPTLRLSQELGPRTALQVIFLSATLAILWHHRSARLGSGAASSQRPSPTHRPLHPTGTGSGR